MDATDLVKQYRYCTNHFNRDEYPILFERIKNALESFLSSISDVPCASRAPGFSNDSDISEYARSKLESSVCEILDEVESNANQHRFKFRKDSAIADDKLLLSLFIVPAAMKINTPEAIEFASLVVEGWNSHYPNDTIKIGDYDELVEGFRWKLTLFSND